MKLIILAFCISFAWTIIWSLCLAAKRGDEAMRDVFRRRE